MLQRALHFVRARYALTVFWAYLAAFGVAFMSIFVFPPAALGLVLVSALLLIPAVAVGALLRAAARVADQPYLRAGVCPVCRANALAAAEGGMQGCTACGAHYGATGAWSPDGAPEHSPAESHAPAGPATHAAHATHAPSAHARG